jgi:hypothetical protein
MSLMYDVKILRLLYAASFCRVLQIMNMELVSGDSKAVFVYIIRGSCEVYSLREAWVLRRETFSESSDTPSLHLW